MGDVLGGSGIESATDSQADKPLAIAGVVAESLAGPRTAFALHVWARTCRSQAGGSPRSSRRAHRRSRVSFVWVCVLTAGHDDPPAVDSLSRTLDEAVGPRNYRRR